MIQSLSFSRSFLAWILIGGLVLIGNLPLLAQNTGPAPAPESGGLLNFQNAKVDSILDTYEQLSGKHLIRDVQLNNAPPISINATGLSKAEGLKMIEATLLLNGIAFVIVDDHTSKVIMVGQAKNPRSEGVKIYANAADLPQTDEVVSYYMPLSYITPVEAQTIFTSQAPLHSYGAYTVAPSAQAIILTENTSVIRELIAIKELVDVPPASVVSEFIQLNRADAEKVADILTKMLAPPATPGAAPAGGAGSVPAGVGNQAPLSNEHNLISGTAQIIPDTRSNRLLIVTRPVNIPFFKQIVSQLDQPDIYMVPQRRPLKYVLAQDILPALESALAQGKEEEKEVEKTAGGTNGTNNNANNNQGSGSNSSTAASNGAGTVSAITPQLQAPAENYVPTVVTIGKTRLLADNRSNSIIVFGSPDVTGRVFGMIDELDRKPLQVYLATVIGELTVTEGEEFGIDWLQKYAGSPTNGVASSSLTTGKGTTASSFIPEPGNLLNSAVFPLASGLTLYGQIGGTINAYVRALETTDRFKVLSRPSVYTTNNKLAVIASGSQVPVPSNITSGFTGTTGTDVNNGLTTTANIAYQNVLLQLDIIPLINANREVTLKIRQTDNTLGANNVISGNNVPTINTQEINTEITVHDKSTVVIGGLITDTSKRDTTGVPLLSDIPVLGYLFKDTSKSKERDELIIMIQPSVVENDVDQNDVDKAEKQRTLLGQEAERAASGFTDDVPKSFLPQKTTTTTTTTTTATSASHNSKGNTSIKTSTTEMTAPSSP